MVSSENNVEQNIYFHWIFFT